MNIDRFRAWRFVHPDTDRTGEFGGIQISPAGRIEMVSEANSIRQSILMILSTIPGERVMRPTYGCHINRLMFWPNDDTTAGLAIHYVSRALERWEPRIDIEKVDAQRDPHSPSRMNVVLVYRIRSTQQMDRIIFPFDLAGMEVV